MEFSREEILKKFDLPERKTKIETILKMKNHAPVYCTCKSTDISRFMICCEKCDEWYHGDCIGMAERDSKYIKRWYCAECIIRYNLEVVYFSRNSKPSSKHTINHKNKLSPEIDSSETDSFRCGKCSNCLQNEECGNKDFILALKRRKIENYEAPVKENVNGKSKNYRKKYKSMYLNGWTASCKGPECVQPARMNSKYCSEECGLALAKLRILNIIPYRLAEREQTPCVADKIDKAKLDQVRMQIKISTEELKKLDYKEKKLTDIITRVKKAPVLDIQDFPEDESKMYCITCGWEIPIRSACKHMGICFKKFESQTAVFGLTKSNTDKCNIFCDFYDTAKKTYCKRLRYVCPDHCKPKKIQENEVCGCPIINTISLNILSGTEKFCQRAKKKCDDHYNWELLTLAEVDLERLREWNKISELVEQEAAIHRQLSNRSGVLGLLLHSTYVH